MYYTQVAMVAVFPLLLLLSSSSPIVGAADAEHEYTLVATSSLKPKASCSGHRVTPPQNRTWVPLNLPHGPCSPASDAATPSLFELLHQDQLRVDDIRRRLSDDSPRGQAAQGKSSSERTAMAKGALIQQRIGGGAGGSFRGSQLSSDPAATGGRSGLPGVVQTLVVDTASDVPWVQCVPCPVPPCHPQTDTVYDPTRSPTYAAIPCNATACTRLGQYANGCINNQCQYRVTYPDGSSSSGTYISDLLTINPTSAISNFQFGCSHVEQGSFDNRTAGIMALGGGPESLLSQTTFRYGKAFSYCIPPTASYSGFFVLGAPHVASSRYVVTPMLRYKQVPTFYRVLLRTITVAGQQLNVAPSVFAAGSVLDSRTTITRLPPTAYQALRAAFRNSMRMYRSAPPKGNLDTCYDFRGVGTIRLPRIALVFDRNAVVELDPSGVLFNDCLAFIPNSDDRIPGILGNLQQQTIEVLYDVGGGAVGFRRGAC